MAGAQNPVGSRFLQKNPRMSISGWLAAQLILQLATQMMVLVIWLVWIQKSSVLIHLIGSREAPKVKESWQNTLNFVIKNIRISSNIDQHTSWRCLSIQRCLERTSKLPTLKPCFSSEQHREGRFQRLQRWLRFSLTKLCYLRTLSSLHIYKF